MRLPTRLILPVLAASVVAPAVTAEAGKHPTSCGSPESRTLHENKQVRVYEHHGALEACRFRTGFRVKLALPRQAEEHWYQKPALKLAGTIVGYAVTGPTDPNEGENINTIERFDMRGVSEPGFVNYHSLPAGRGTPKIGSLVLRSNGAVAWITCPGRS